MDGPTTSGFIDREVDGIEILEEFRRNGFSIAKEEN